MLRQQKPDGLSLALRQLRPAVRDDGAGRSGQRHIDQLRRRVLLRSVFDDNADYVRPCKCKTEAIAAGSALNYISVFLNSI